MTIVGLALNVFLAVLLIVALGFGWRLERRLKALRDSHAGFAKAVADLDQAAARAEQGLADLRAATDEAAEVLAVRIERAQALAVQLDERINRPLPAPTAAAAPARERAPREPREAREPREETPAPRADRRLKAEDFERMIERETRAGGRPPADPASRPATNETPRSRARIDDDLFDGPAQSPRPGSNFRAPR